MSTSENKRAGREKELREKLRVTGERFKDVFGKELDSEVLAEFLTESEKRNRLTFLTDKIGYLSDFDTSYLRTLLRNSVTQKEVEETEVEDVEIDDLGSDEEELVE